VTGVDIEQRLPVRVVLFELDIETGSRWVRRPPSEAVRYYERSLSPFVELPKKSFRRRCGLPTIGGQIRRRDPFRTIVDVERVERIAMKTREVGKRLRACNDTKGPERRKRVLHHAARADRATRNQIIREIRERHVLMAVVLLWPCRMRPSPSEVAHKIRIRGIAGNRIL
jgi:hypothetical protein